MYREGFRLQTTCPALTLVLRGWDIGRDIAHQSLPQAKQAQQREINVIYCLLLTYKSNKS